MASKKKSKVKKNEMPKIKDHRVIELTNILLKVGGKVLVIDHPYGDPDSIASKYGLRYILAKQFNLEVDIAYSHEVSHFQNKTLTKLLDSHYGFQPLSIESVSLDDYEIIFCADFNLSNTNIPFENSEIYEGASRKFMVIDHHKKTKRDVEIEPIFEDIVESGICSTSTRVIEYLESLGIKLKSDNEEQKLLATALCFGVENDALSGGKKQRDRQALAYIGEAISSDLEKRLTEISRSPQSQDAIGEGMKNRRKAGNIYCIGSAGIIIEDNKNAIAELSDQLVMEAGIEVSIAYGVINDKIEMSFRALHSSSISAAKVAQLFGGGGRTDAAGATVDLGPFRDYPSNDEESKSLLMKAIEDLLIIPKLKSITG